jgi:hypothetical protein
MTIKERRERALAWLEAIYRDYVHAVLNYHVFWEVNKLFDNLKGMPDRFPAWMLDVYTDSIALAVRRQVEQGKDPKGRTRDIISLRSLLEELADHPDIVTREYYRSFRKALDKEAGDREFDKLVGVGQQQLVRTTIEREIRRLEGVSDIIRRYVNRHIAHKAQRPGKHVPTHEDVQNCLTVMADLIARYSTLLKGTSIRPGKVDSASPLKAFVRDPTEEEMLLVPTIMDDWQAVFRVPWSRDDEDKP